MIANWLFVLIGAAVVGLIWAVVHNMREHPGKVEGEIAKAETAVKNKIAKL